MLVSDPAETVRISLTDAVNGRDVDGVIEAVHGCVGEEVDGMLGVVVGGPENEGELDFGVEDTEPSNDAVCVGASDCVDAGSEEVEDVVPGTDTVTVSLTDWVAESRCVEEPTKDVEAVEDNVIDNKREAVVTKLSVAVVDSVEV